MADMIKFFKGLEASLPASGVNGALYITTDEGAIYLGTGTGMKRLGDFVQVANVASLPAKAHESCLYYCVAENILAKWNGTEWKQINKQPTAEEMKTLLGLGSMAYKSEVAEGDLNADLKAKVNAAAEGNHSHDNKALLDTYTQTEADLADTVAKKHNHANADELAKIADGDKAKWDAVAADHLTSADKTTLENSIKDAKKAGTDANTALETYKVSNDARVKAVEDDIAEITNADNGILVQAKAYADGKDDAIAAAKKAGDDAQADIDAYIESNDAALAGVKATAEAAAVKTEVEAELAKKVDKVEGKSLVADTEIARLAAMSDGANKVEASNTNGNIKIDGVETTVYTHPEKHAIADVTGLQDALDGKQAAGDYATKTEAQGYANAKDEAIAAAKKAGEDAQADVDALEKYVGTFDNDEATTVVEYIDALTNGVVYSTTTDAIVERIEEIERVQLTGDDKTELSNAIALKADKSVVDAMYTNAQIDGFIAEAKKYADDNDADTKYGIVYDSDNKKIKLVEGGTDVEIDASAFIKDGMINTVTIDDNDDLIITFNTDAGKENIVLPLDQLVDIYTGVEGARIKVTVNADKSISADLIAGSISKDYLDDGVKASLALADSAIQDISHLATTEALNGVDAKFANYNTTAVQKEIDDAQNARIKAIEDDYVVAADIADFETKANVKKVADDLSAYKTSNEAAVALKANAADVYAKTETYTQAEVDALIEAAHTWGEF